LAGRYIVRMKFLLVIAALLSLNSCNTLIGLGRDTKEGYRWTKKKIQGEEVIPEANAPVY
jgi:predicted small secreted protein